MGKYGPKWFDVDISDQSIIAYEGDTPVYTARVSTGTWKYPTVEGTYRVYAKYVSTKMEGGQGTPDYYYIPNVPYTMYFYGSYALHGAFWHNKFGNQMSHGCVNLPVEVAGDGRGGRNQELALALAERIAGRDDVAALAAGTDGIDGPTDAAGAFVDGETGARARRRGLEPREFLRRNDSHGFFSKMGDLYRPGPTGTNVMDLTIVLVGARA